MNPKIAKILLIFFGVLSIPATLYPLFDAYSVLYQTSTNAEKIEFDTGSFYLLLMSLFWLGGIIHLSGMYCQKLKKAESFNLLKKASIYVYEKANYIFIAWFVLCLIAATVTPRIIVKHIENAGYIACNDAQEVSRVSRGDSLVFIKTGNCPSS